MFFKYPTNKKPAKIKVSAGLQQTYTCITSTMNAFEAAEKNGKAAELQHELEVLFNNQNKSSDPNTTSIPATFLKVTVNR